MTELNSSYHPVNQLFYHRQKTSDNFTNQSIPVLHRFPQFAWYDDIGVPARCSVPEVAPVDGNRFAVPINGGLVPSLALLTVITNALVCAVLLRKNMRTSTNALLVAMAMTDTLTGIGPVPFFVHLYTLRGYSDPLGYWWCRMYYWMTDYLPTVFHTASVWLTVALATERYLQVCHRLVAKNICTIRNTIRVSIINVIADDSF
jgi:7 transmembrane receptor (rhodopsin family)